jgi:Cu(I)/Ag(I) efflux system membrane fusion protein/cobalt-zinc-cadmium efflux system membrane fusion protein
MFAQVELPAGSGAKVLTVPVSAVIDSGQRQMVLVQKGDAASGRFEPRSVKLGARSDNYLQVLEGLTDGEQVVTSANFLIDAESNLKAAIAGFGAAATDAPAQAGGMGSMSSNPVGHQAEGKVEEWDAKTQTVTISHGPVASLKWPGMTMDFALAHSGLQKDLQPGAAVRFEFVERGKGEWVITKATPSPASQAK